MRSFVLAIIVGVFAALVTGQLFRNAFERKIERRLEAIIASSTYSAPPTDSETPFQPPEEQFTGPVGKPYIIGPYGPPPNR